MTFNQDSDILQFLENYFSQYPEPFDYKGFKMYWIFGTVHYYIKYDSARVDCFNISLNLSRYYFRGILNMFLKGYPLEAKNAPKN